LFIPASRFCQYKIGLAKSFKSMDNIFQEAGPRNSAVPGGWFAQFAGCTGVKAPEKNIFISGFYS
jgi:hypothetical protein